MIAEGTIPEITKNPASMIESVFSAENEFASTGTDGC